VPDPPKKTDCVFSRIGYEGREVGLHAIHELAEFFLRGQMSEATWRTITESVVVAGLGLRRTSRRTFLRLSFSENTREDIVRRHCEVALIVDLAPT